MTPQSDRPGQLPAAPAPVRVHVTPTVDNTPPTRSKVTGTLAALACAACCALPFLLAAGVLTGVGAAVVEQTLLAASASLVVLALGMWWLDRRSTARKAAAASSGCANGNCSC
jgi:hypothetical protein